MHKQGTRLSLAVISAFIVRPCDRLAFPYTLRDTLRGLEKAKLEWTLVSTAYNLKRLHRIVGTV